MSVLSTLSRVHKLTKVINKESISRLFLSKDQNAFKQAVRKMGGGNEERIFHITPSRFQYTKFKDDLHFYITLGVVPLTLLITLVNIFIGPATLSEIPEGYVPANHEYYRHPFERFIAKYIRDDPQVIHEKNLHYLNEENERFQWRQKIDKVKDLMAERDDYKSIYYIPSDKGRHYRYARKMWDGVEESKGYR